MMSSLRKDCSYRYVLVQNWGFRMNCNKVKTKKAVNDNKMMQYSTPNLMRSLGLQCPLGCQAEEDIDPRLAWFGVVS